MKRFTLPVACLALSVVAGSAQAIVLNPGDAAYLPGVAGVLGNAIAVNQAQITGINAASETRFTGTLYFDVYQEANGNLDFWYQYINDQTSPDAVERLTMTNFAGYSTDVDYLANSGDVAPTYADRSNDGGVIGFQFVQPIGDFFPGNGTINPGSSSDWMVIRTNAKQYTAGTTSVIDGAVATVETYAPVPEPASLLAIGTGIVGLVRRRKQSR